MTHDGDVRLERNHPTDEQCCRACSPLPLRKLWHVLFLIILRMSERISTRSELGGRPQRPHTHRRNRQRGSVPPMQGRRCHARASADVHPQGALQPATTRLHQRASGCLPAQRQEPRRRAGTALNACSPSGLRTPSTRTFARVARNTREGQVSKEWLAWARTGQRSESSSHFATRCAGAQALGAT